MGVLHPLINKEDKTMKIDHRTRLAKVFRNPALKPYWKYVMYRIVHPILRQTVWLNPHVSLADKWTFVKQLFVRIKL